MIDGAPASPLARVCRASTTAHAVTKTAAALVGQAVGGDRDDLVPRVARRAITIGGLDASGVCVAYALVGGSIATAMAAGDGALAARATILVHVSLAFLVADFGSTATDVLYQQLTVPAGTTQLVLTGYNYVATGETSTTSAYDRATVSVTRADGTAIQSVRSLSNLTPTTAWTAFSHTFTQDLSGQVIRVRMTSSNDFLDATSFWFDTLVLTATGCP